ncbi:hypothetical protein EON66_12205 [archaeon]|nr:MAG: hypothetical protein EON66_12205 [archaeon]
MRTAPIAAAVASYHVAHRLYAPRHGDAHTSAVHDEHNSRCSHCTAHCTRRLPSAPPAFPDLVHG